MISGLQGLLDELAAEHDVPGASLAVLDGDDMDTAATGVVSKHTGVEVTPDTVFQIGSITKVYTATQVLQLVDDGKVELDAPVRRYLPHLQLSDPEATEIVTVRNLLSHTSGVDGDYTPDLGPGDDCVARYVASLPSVPQISPPGKMFSYSNAGFVIAAALVAELTGRIWDEALKERLVGPLGLRGTVTLPEEAILRRAAVGHLDPTGSGEQTPTETWRLPRSAGRSGIVSTAADVLSFVRMHLDEGVAADGARVLSKESVRQMQEHQVDVPDSWSATGRGLGWAIYERGGKVIGHDGGTIGQQAFLRVVPDTRYAVALVTNGTTGGALYRDLFKQLLGERGVELPDPPSPVEGVEFDPSLFAGTYERTNLQTRIEVADGGLVGSVEYGGFLKGIAPSLHGERLRPIDGTTFLIDWPGAEAGLPMIFMDFDESGRPRYLHSGGRANVRVD